MLFNWATISTSNEGTITICSLVNRNAGTTARRGLMDALSYYSVADNLFASRCHHRLDHRNPDQNRSGGPTLRIYWPPWCPHLEPSHGNRQPGMLQSYAPAHAPPRLIAGPDHDDGAILGVQANSFEYCSISDAAVHGGRAQEGFYR